MESWLGSCLTARMHITIFMHKYRCATDSHYKMVAKPAPKGTIMEYKIKDINLAVEGRKELDLAETEMPGLMALRKE